MVNFGSAFCRLCTWGDDLLLTKREHIFKVDKTWLIIKCVCYWERSNTCKKRRRKVGCFGSHLWRYLKGIMYMHAFSIFANNKISSMINSWNLSPQKAWLKEQFVLCSRRMRWLMSKLNSLARENFPGLLLFLYMRHDGNDVQQQQQVSSHHKTSWMYWECLLLL